jgi:peptidoglycan biosynthesis protein MviN/MurJ (putative lipid II flippase)
MNRLVAVDDVVTGRELRPMASHAAVTAVSQLATMALGAVVALVILVRFGKTTATDGLFAAYGVYGVAVVVAQSFRTTIAARLVEGPSLFSALDRYLGGVVAIFVASAIPFVALGEPFSRLMVGHLGPAATHTARTALVILWLAAGAQLVSALLATALALREEFAVPGAAYILGGVVSIVGVGSLAPVLGIQAVAVALCLGGAATAVLLLARLAHLGYRPTLSRLVPNRSSGARGAVLVWASVGAIYGQGAYVVTVGFAARLGKGSPTLFAYASLLFFLLMAAISGSMTIVLAPRLAETWDRRPASLHQPMLETFRAGLMMVVPSVAVVAIAGPGVVALALGARDAHQMIDVFLALSGGLIAGIAVPVPLIAMYTHRRYSVLAALSVLGVIVQFGLCVLALRFHSLVALAVASTATGLLGALALFSLVFGQRTGAVLTLLGSELLLVAAVAALTFLPAAWVGSLEGSAVQPIAALVGLGAFLAIAQRALPRHWELIQRALAPLRPRMGWLTFSRS